VDKTAETLQMGRRYVPYTFGSHLGPPLTGSNPRRIIEFVTDLTRKRVHPRVNVSKSIWLTSYPKRGIMAHEAHKKAAEHHEHAAKAHHEAAKHHEAGDHEAAAEHTAKAHEHSTAAHGHSTDAHTKSAAKK
jgi:hypothetical protein